MHLHANNEIDHLTNAFRFQLQTADKTETEKANVNFDIFLNEWISQITSLNLKESDKNTVLNSCKVLMERTGQFNITLINENNGLHSTDVIDISTTLINNKIEKFITKYKRDKKISADPAYVKPQEKALCTRYEMIRNKTTGIAVPRIIQSKFQYVSIIDTLRSLFEKDEFCQLYVQHNLSQEKHICVQGEYNYFCCGEAYKKNELYKSNPGSLQIQIATDDFEVCSPLQSKTKIHKICAVYFRITNLPQQYSSRLNNIYLICLCNTEDLKTKQTDFNDIWRLIVQDVSHLEQFGIDLKNNLNIKGTVSYLGFDNLGANVSLGFSEGFNSFYYCRICESDKEECKHLTKDIADKYRNKEKYEKQLNVISSLVKVKYRLTTGVKRYCVLNDLKYFNIFENPSVDIMHDINEGVIPFLLKNLFQYLISNKVVSEDQIIKLIQSFDYGFLNQRNVPSILCIDKHNLGQNATQVKCLFLNIPFIFIDFKDHQKVKNVWPCVESLLKICEIIYSSKITEDDLILLENSVSFHLESIQKVFQVDLIPKHHFMVHYATVIRLMGPIVHMNMSRFESKHKCFKDMVHETYNFKNITRTLAVKHQQKMVGNKNTYKDEMQTGKKIPLENVDVINYENLLSPFLNDNKKILQTKWLKWNGYDYRKGLIIIFNHTLYEIANILANIENHFYFLCFQLTFLSADKFSNSLKINTTQPLKHVLIEFDTIEKHKPYEKKNIRGDFYIICDTLHLQNSVQK